MNARYKSILAALAVLLILLCLQGCKSSNPDTSSDNAPPTPPAAEQTASDVPEETDAEGPSPSVRTKEEMMQDFQRDGQLTLSGPEETEIFLAACQEDSEFYNLFFGDFAGPELTQEEEQDALDAYKQQMQQEAAEQFQNGQHEYEKPDVDALIEDAQNQLVQEDTDENDDFVDYDSSLNNY